MTPSSLISAVVKLFCGFNKFSNSSSSLNSQTLFMTTSASIKAGEKRGLRGKSGCNSKCNRAEEKSRVYSTGVIVFLKRRMLLSYILTELNRSGALMLVRDVKLKVSWRMFWLQGFMWLILIKAVMILLKLFHSLCLCYYPSWALSTLIAIIFYLCFYTARLFSHFFLSVSFFSFVSLSIYSPLQPDPRLSSLPLVVFTVCLSSTYRHTCTPLLSLPPIFVVLSWVKGCLSLQTGASVRQRSET